MLHRFLIYFSFVVLFAFTQIGITTHEISHLSDLTEHSQQDKQAPNHQCEQCVSHADVETGLVSSATTLVLSQSDIVLIAAGATSFLKLSNRTYCARAPPQIA